MSEEKYISVLRVVFPVTFFLAFILFAAVAGNGLRHRVVLNRFGQPVVLNTCWPFAFIALVNAYSKTFKDKKGNKKFQKG